MELVKKKYKQSEVSEIIEKSISFYKEGMSELKTTVSELKDENRRLNEELSLYKDKDTLISETLKKTESISKGVNKETELRYALTVEYLRSFIKRWRNYFEFLKEKYPMYPVIEEAVKLKEELDLLLKGKGSNREIVENVETKLSVNEKSSGSKVFNPKEKIKEYVAATSSEGFNLDEVLNPGDLKLEDLCKELGLME